MTELLVVCLVVVAIGGIATVVLDYPIDAAEDPARSGTGWVRAALAFVRVLQGLIVLAVISFVVVWWFSNESVSFKLGGGSVTVSGGGSVVVRGEPGYMVDICTGESGPPGGWTAAELCPREQTVKEAFGRDAGPDRAIIRKLDRDPGVGVWLLLSLGLVGVAAYVGLLHALAQMLKRAAAGRPFDSQSVRSLRVMAGALVVGGSIVPGLSALVTRSVVNGALGDGSVPDGTVGVPLWPWGMALMLVALAEVWRYGIRLQEDAEATV